MSEPMPQYPDGLTGEPLKGCFYCRHNRGDWTCAAFPDGIPFPILAGDEPHDQPLPGDHGIQFEPILIEVQSKD